ncbi:type II toxin-antitoxin system VapC family toxin [Thermodesulfobacteriota bacterium]
MAGREESLAYLDTHILLWLYAGLTGKLTKRAKETIQACDLLVSQFSRLEIQYLYEIGRITAKPSAILKSLEKSINLKAADCHLVKVVDEALKIGWTRDVFDRLLISEAKVKKCGLVTADNNIREHFKQAIW